MILHEQVQQLEERAAQLDWIVGQMIATIRINLEHGFLKCINPEAEAALKVWLAKWDSELARIRKAGG